MARRIERRGDRGAGPPHKAGFVFLGLDGSVHQTGRESPDSAEVAPIAAKGKRGFRCLCPR